MIDENQDIKQELEDILISVAEAKSIKSYEISLDIIPKEGEGFLSEFFTGQILNKNNGENTKIAVKRSTAKSIVSGVGPLYKNEIGFYSKIFPELHKFQIENGVSIPFDNIPTYFVGNLEPQKEFLAMENLKAEGYTLFDKRKFFDTEHLELIFRTYGKFHALSFTYQQLKPEKYCSLIGDLVNLSEGLEGFDIFKEVKISYQNALEAFDPITESDILIKLKTIENCAEVMMKAGSYTGKYSCLIHGDCWSNNMLFKYKDSEKLEDIKLIDFQVTSNNTPILDLSYFFYSGSSKEDMDKLDYYLDLYCQSFSNFSKELGGNPEKMLTLDILKKEWKVHAVCGLLMACNSFITKLLDMEELIELAKKENLSKIKYFIVMGEKVTSIRMGEEFRKRAKNMLIHAVEYGVI